jgi:hypothetical protein
MNLYFLQTIENFIMTTNYSRRVFASSVSPLKPNHLLPFPSGNGLFSIKDVDYVGSIPNAAIVAKNGGTDGKTIAYLPFVEDGEEKEFVLRMLTDFVLGKRDIPNDFDWSIAYEDYSSELTEPEVMQPVPETNKGKKNRC